MNYSVITPTYKNPEEVEKFLLAFNKVEKPDNYELLILDDSPDNLVGNVVEKFKNSLTINFIKFKRKLFISQKKNLGIKKAKNELIFFIDSDIELEKNSLRVLINTLAKYPEVAMLGGRVFQGEHQLQPTKQDRLLKKNDIVFCEVMYSPYLCLYKSVFLKIGGYDEIFENRGEGTDLSIKFWRGGFPIARNLKAIVHHPPFKKQRKSPQKIAEMYRSLFLIGYKYGINPQENPHFIEMYQERKEAYGEVCEFYSIYTFATYLDWFVKNYSLIQQSKKNIPQTYNFKPFDIFSNRELLKDCLARAKEKITIAYKKTFGENKFIS